MTERSPGGHRLSRAWHAVLLVVVAGSLVVRPAGAPERRPPLLRSMVDARRLARNAGLVFVLALALALVLRWLDGGLPTITK